ncbi:hypothetical protein ACOSQ2_005144 [Xanthoceras sorbifolium]
MAPTAAMLILSRSHNNHPLSSAPPLAAAAAAAAASPFLEAKVSAVKWVPQGCLAIFKSRSEAKPSSGVDSSSFALEKKFEQALEFSCFW